MKQYGFDHRTGKDEVYFFLTQEQGFQLMKDLVDLLSCEGSEIQLFVKGVRQVHEWDNGKENLRGEK